ncbi:MAG: sigma 54-interacting transcriptional regulator, partial [Planctomycetes bacterium]|nr:sigma 54-interacting transcriptional regulator [Planctomycetota bacterium]
VLLLGETGTGKEIAARALHAESRRASGPFVAVNCGAIPESLVESVLFGHERGSFTGADETRPGLFERGDRGTVLLDEVGELPHPMQVKLLRVLQDRCVQRIGASSERSVDVRVIAATNRDLHADVERGRVRQDLYYRLAVFPVTMPPLRERGADVLLLAECTLARLGEAQGRDFRGFTDEAKQALAAWRWPGNVRELQNVVERATLLESGALIRLASLSDEIVAQRFADPVDALVPCDATGHDATDDGVVRPLEEEERRVVERALRLLDWNIQETAARLGIGRATLYRRMHAWGLARPGEVPVLAGDGD